MRASPLLLAVLTRLLAQCLMGDCWILCAAVHKFGRGWELREGACWGVGGGAAALGVRRPPCL